MNIKHRLRRFASSIFKSLPVFVHHQVLKQYELDRIVAVEAGYVCVKQDWSSPVVVREEIEVSRLGKKRILPGVLMDPGEFARLGGELAAFAGEFPWRNGQNGEPEVPWGFMFPTIDSVVLYSMIRHFKPRTYIEVGCGYSSRVSSAAASLNSSHGNLTAVTYIEPYPGERLEKDKLCGELMIKRIQDVPLEAFASLQAGDMLFIDTSHIIKCQSDVEWELLHILPTLRKGVIVHVHDIYTPFEYPLEWIENNYAPGQYNEQYALEALLSGGGRFKPLFPVHFMCRNHSSDLHRWFGTQADISRSFWIVVE